MSDILKKLIARAIDSALPTADAERAFDIIMSGDATQAQIGGFLMVLRLRGESIEEITAAARVMRAKVKRVHAPVGAMDIVGTGGDGKGTLNISTAAALITAGAGVPIAKHGNKALSSKSGAADALAALGVTLTGDVATMERAIGEAGIGYMNAPNHHAAMRHVGPARVDLGVRTIFNILGPLTNPALVTRQLSGAFSPALIRPMAETLGALGSERAWVAHGSDGTDEISIAGPTAIAEWADGEVREFTVSPRDAGLKAHPFGDILGGTPQENVAKMLRLLDGDQSDDVAAYRAASILNAAAALLIAGKAGDLREGATLAAASIDEGKAKAALDGLIRITASAAA